jgi:flagellar basal-body rod protein FlgB
MAFDDLTIFSAVKKRLGWLTQRQEVLAQNIANADTPKYRASDLKPYQFKDLIRRESMQLNMNVSDSSHIGGRRKRIRDYAETPDRKPFETAPGGNSVILEEQMSKINESQINHKLTTNIYKKHLLMFRMALGKQ